ncbi:hypothetical protein D3C81_643420 [compost metagenome]
MTPIFIKRTVPEVTTLIFRATTWRADWQLPPSKINSIYWQFMRYVSVATIFQGHMVRATINERRQTVASILSLTLPMPINRVMKFLTPQVIWSRGC